MLTKNEITALNLSPTKKDFVQIWNELLEVAGRLSERWDPTSTNESDPGIVILKALTGIADKLNYNIDKNTLEAFMPTAAQEESMRKLCDMLGYNVKYYRSAETTVSIKYYNSDPSSDEKDALQYGLIIPKFTVITNSDQDINYFTTNENLLYISSTTPTIEGIPCIEGQIVKCESTADNNVITASQITDNNRFYLPEYQIAENGIFVYNVVANHEDGDIWKKVDNLNTQARGSRIFKFGYDSYEGRPYLEFPEDYSELINDGLFIYYTRTSGASGNISARVLTQIELPTGEGWDKVSAESFSVENSFSATTGSNVETISQAYNNFKKTVGTFETLVTCRDYMNKIYNMTDPDNGKYLVSNALVTDIRTDLNRAITICSCDDAGIYYKDTPIVISTLNTTSLSEECSPQIDGNPEITETFVASTANKPTYLGDVPAHYQYGDTFGSSGFFTRYAYWRLGDKDGLPIFNDSYSRDFIKDTNFIDKDGGSVSEYTSSGDRSKVWIINQNNKSYETTLPINWIISTETVQTNIIETKTITNQVIKTDTPAIDHFDLVLYPFKSYNQIRSNVKDIQAAYDRSFTYERNNTVKDLLEGSGIKTIAHNIIFPRSGDIVSINNYLRLNAIIGTTSKVTVEEGKLLIEKIKIALANAFNMRELDFGDEIPFDNILNVIEKADARISVVSLAEPALYTTFSIYEDVEGASSPVLREYAVASDWLTETYVNSSNRFEYVDEIANADNSAIEYIPVHTFDTVEAKKIYNKLAVRNVLAGRVPLFKYNTTFKSSFSDGAYRTTKNTLDVNLTESSGGINKEPNADNPFTIWTEDGKTYTGQYQEVSAEEIPTEFLPDEKNPKLCDRNEAVTYELLGPQSEPSYAKIIYTETSTPEEYIDNIIAKNDDDDTNYTELEAKCEVFPDKDSNGNSTTHISNVELAEGEFIRFRAPNFITDKTYPAYVNYHLELANGLADSSTSSSLAKEATSAEATTLFKLLVEDRSSSGEEWRNAVSTYFKDSPNKKKFTLVQTIYGSNTVQESISSGITVKIDDANQTNQETPEQILNKSGFVKLVNNSAALPSGNKLKIYLHDDFKNVTADVSSSVSTTDYVLTVGTFTTIKTAVDDYLGTLTSSMPSEDWTISYDFEYIPFELATLKEWNSFIENSSGLLGYTPIKEEGTVLWRTYQGSYQAGKYILPNEIDMLMPFSSGHFGLLDTNRLSSIYIVKNLGEDAIPNYVSNNEEYQLRGNDRLYIEYTPSTTTEEGTTETQKPVLEVLGAGTILKPSGFEGLGLIGSGALGSDGKSSHKTVDFSSITGNSADSKIAMYSLGASEQIAVRKLSKVELNTETLSSSPTIYLYKNFSNCEELENFDKRKPYTLKDGEYIFYTDQNQTEFAYFTSGTQVTLEGRKDIVIPKCELVDLATIFDSGVQSIPWASSITLGKKDSITFQEFQYITIGPNDTLRSLLLYDTSETETLDGKKQNCLNDEWQKCAKATYVVAGTDTPVDLNKINLSSGTVGSGWEVCSILELNSSPNTTQTLRSTDKVKTSVTLYDAPASGVEEPRIVAELEAADANHPLSFKSNLSCVSSTGKLNINDIYSNSDIKSFEIKVLSEQPPAIIKTQQDKLVPCVDSNITDISMWTAQAEKTFANKSYGELWTRVPLVYLESNTNEGYDRALKLSVGVLPNTYGIFSIYIKYGESAEDLDTWIDLLPGTSKDDITLLNVPSNEIFWKEDLNHNYIRLMLKPGINCIRVNKTCDLFIKTSLSKPTSEDEDSEKKYEKQSVSTLYFDDLRLVDCQPIEYVENGEKKFQKTQGINLSQIGYLDAEKIDPLNSFDLQIRRKLKEEYTDSALKSLNTLAQADSKSLSESKEKLREFSPKIKKLVEFINSASTELDELKSKSQLFENYRNIYNDLEAEISLKEALSDNKNIEDLVDLLETFADYADIKQDILDKLDILTKTAEANLDVFDKTRMSKGDILDDFELVACSDDDQLIDDLKLASLDEINAEYTRRLSTLASAVEAVTNDEIRENLLSMLEGLNAHKHAELISQIQVLVEANQKSIMEALDEARICIAGVYNEDGEIEVDYTKLKEILISIRGQCATANIEELISKIEQAMSGDMENDDRYSALAAYLDELSRVLGNTTNTFGSYEDFITELDKVVFKIDDSVVDTVPTEDDIKTLSVIASTTYTDELKAILDKIQITLKDIEASYTTSTASLKNTEDAAVSAILASLDKYTKFRGDQVALVTNFGESNFYNYLTELPYGASAVLAVWPAHMKQDYISCLTGLHKTIRAAIANEDTTYTLEPCIYTSSGALRATLARLIDLESFKGLFNQAIVVATKDSQNNARKNLINELGKHITLPDADLTALHSALKEDGIVGNDKISRHERLYLLINNLNGSENISEKYNLIQEIKTELESVINIDSQIIKISTDLLCPSILNFDSSGLQNDEFYSKLAEFASEWRNSLMNYENIEDEGKNNFSGAIDLIKAEISSLSTNNIAAILDKLEAGDTASLTSESYNEEILVDECTEAINNVIRIVIRQDLINKIKNSKLLTILLNKELVVAWGEKITSDNNSITNWLDSSGNYYQKYDSSAEVWKAYPVSGTASEQTAWLKAGGNYKDKSGFWRTQNGLVVKVDVKREYDKDSVWTDDSSAVGGSDVAIIVKDNDGWLYIDSNKESKSFTLSSDTELEEILTSLLNKVETLGQLNYMSEDTKSAYSTLLLETQLLNEIKQLDRNREFYYNVPIESNVAIDFNEGETKLNTLMNPATNYDINNINNNFVISKIDINYLNNGLQIARSSKLN